MRRTVKIDKFAEIVNSEGYNGSLLTCKKLLADIAKSAQNTFGKDRVCLSVYIDDSYSIEDELYMYPAPSETTLCKIEASRCWAYISIYFPEIKVRSASNCSYTITDCYIVFPIIKYINNRLLYPQDKVYLFRSSFSMRELACGYKHSHVPNFYRISTDDALVYQTLESSHICLGRSDASFLVDKLQQQVLLRECQEKNSDYTESWILFMTSVASLLEFQDDAGIPYISLETIPAVLSSAETNYHLCRLVDGIPWALFEIRSEDEWVCIRSFIKMILGSILEHDLIDTFKNNITVLDAFTISSIILDPILKSLSNADFQTLCSLKILLVIRHGRPATVCANHSRSNTNHLVNVSAVDNKPLFQFNDKVIHLKFRDTIDYYLFSNFLVNFPLFISHNFLNFVRIIIANQVTNL